MTWVLQQGSSVCSLNAGDEPIGIEARKVRFGGGKQ